MSFQIWFCDTGVFFVQTRILVPGLVKLLSRSITSSGLSKLRMLKIFENIYLVFVAGLRKENDSLGGKRNRVFGELDLYCTNGGGKRTGSPRNSVEHRISNV